MIHSKEHISAFEGGRPPPSSPPSRGLRSLPALPQTQFSQRQSGGWPLPAASVSVGQEGFSPRLLELAR